MSTEELTLGIDIGAHKVCLILFDGTKIVDERYNPYPLEVAKDFDLWHEWLSADIHEFIHARNIKSTGLCCAGVVSEGVVQQSPHLMILNGKKLSTLFDSIVTIDTAENDAKAFLAAEVYMGSAKNYSHVLALTLGTGIGGAILINGAFLRGVHNAAGEVGHMLLDGGKTFEECASSRFLHTLSTLSPLELENAAKSGNKEAQEAYSKFGTNVGKGIANLINILDPEIVVLGGGLSHAHTHFMPSLKEQLEKNVLLLQAQHTPVKVSKAGRDGPALGAAILALKKI